MQLDFEELCKQAKENALNSKEYVKIEIVVGKHEEIPFIHYEMRAGIMEEVKALTFLKELYRTVLEKEPWLEPFIETFNIKKSIIKDSEKEDLDIIERNKREDEDNN